MEIKFRIDDRETLERLAGLSTERFMRIWAVAIGNLARNKAQGKASEENGRSFWQREVIQSVREEVTGPDTGVVYSDSYIAEHVHTGGWVKPERTKFLAIPIDRSVRKKFARDIPGLVLFGAKTTKDRDGMFLGKKLYAGGKREKIKPLFVLKRQVWQKPRPWFPTQEEADAETKRFFEEDF